eukprot:TRINITY_DN9294_c0_g1_i1.p1 TRINITY_DN9294_c0_g1~~TRINITY_DN9294_c0_g1_i1.p1  ORF type:complete len:206 (+),score=26.70 TRINITY_DN9294_c0_g1_i1:64-681(+)
MNPVALSPDVFRLDEMAEHYGVDVCCVSWQTEEGVWARIRNNQSIPVVSEEQMDASKLHKVLFSRTAPVFFVDMEEATLISNDPLITQHPKYKFYAEAPVVNSRGTMFGSVSIAHRCRKSCQDIVFPPQDWLSEIRKVAVMLKLDAGSESSSLPLASKVASRKLDNSCRSFSNASTSTASTQGCVDHGQTSVAPRSVFTAALTSS